MCRTDHSPVRCVEVATILLVGNGSSVPDYPGVQAANFRFQSPCGIGAVGLTLLEALTKSVRPKLCYADKPNVRSGQSP